MTELADKRSKPICSFTQRLCLGVALTNVAWYGQAFFEEEGLKEERSRLLEWMRSAFPGDQVAQWANARIPAEEKRWYEQVALLFALQELVQAQLHRASRSGDMLYDFLALYRGLCLGELSKSLPGSEGVTAGPKTVRRRGQPERAADSPEEAALPRSSKRRSEEARFREDLDETLDRLSGQMPVEAQDASSSAEAGMLRLIEEISFGLDHLGLDRGLTRAQLGAVLAALSAMIDKGACWHHRRGKPISSVLSQPQMVALRQACQRKKGLRELLVRCSNKLEEFRPALRPEQVPKKKRRVGSIFLDMAKEASQAGLPHVAAGLRAIDQRAWGLEPDEQQASHEEDAQRWVQGERRLRRLSGLPPLPVLLRLIWQDGTADAAKWFAQHCLRLALLCWPKGSARLASPEWPARQ